MPYSDELVAHKLRRWEKYLNNYKLPEWDAIPDFGLYMEQVIDFLKLQLDYMPPELKEEQFITASTINNYVRTNVMPKPVKKKYYRIHIAYLIIILTLKQSLSIAMIQKIIPMDISEDEIEQIYTNYIKWHSLTAVFFTRSVRDAAAKILNHSDIPELAVDSAEDLILGSAITAGFARLFAEKLLLLDDKDMEETLLDEQPRE